MARPVALNPERAQQVVARAQSGERSEDIARAMGVSVSTVDRVLRKATGPKKTRVSKRIAEEITSAESTDSLPDDISEDDLEKFTRTARKLADSNMPASQAKGVDLWIKIQEHRRKVAPPPKQDPNERPDMIAMAKAAKERLIAYVTKVKIEGGP